MPQVLAFTVGAVEPTGAADTFTDALIARRLARGWRSPKESKPRFTTTADLATIRPGALDGLPVEAEIERPLVTRPD